MNEHQDAAASPWAEAEVIHTYTRAQALEDGVLVDITDIAAEAGFLIPVAVTRGVWGILEPSKELAADGQDWVGRAWDLLTILRLAIRKAGETDTVHFAPLFVVAPGKSAEPVELWSLCGPGDSGEPVITVMLRGED